MRPILIALTCMVMATPALAQLPPGSIGNGGRMPETMSPGALPPPPTMVTPSPTPTWGGQYPNTQSLSRERIESQGYRVDQMNQQLDGSWRGNVSRDPVPTRPQGVPSKVTIFPDGRVLEERQP